MSREAFARLATSLLVMSLGLLVACGDGSTTGGADSTEPTWGPLAVIPGPPSGLAALGHGTLVITDECVTIRSSGPGAPDREALLVWPQEGTRWNPRSETIEYSDGEETVELSDGEEFAFGGGGDTTTESGVEPAEWVESLDWISEPNPSCPMDDRWFVGTIAEPPDEPLS